LITQNGAQGVHPQRAPKKAKGRGVQIGWSSREVGNYEPRSLKAVPIALKKPSLAVFLKAQRNASGLTQLLLAQKVGVRPPYIALLENGRRRPSLGLITPLAAALEIERRDLLELAYPEVRNLMSPRCQLRARTSRSWQRFLENAALLARYRVPRRELEVLQHLATLGGKMTTKRLLAILLLVRDRP
jgi:transcriptional regulator with XRE-family HTH domain